MALSSRPLLVFKRWHQVFGVGVLLVALWGTSSVAAEANHKQRTLSGLDHKTAPLIPDGAFQNKPAAKTLPKIAIIIDDLGDNSVVARQIVALPPQLTLALLPRTPQSKKILAMAKARGFELMMHQPMQAFSRNDLLGPGALLTQMSPQEIRQVFVENLHSLPGIRGFNNHMGSLLSENYQQMETLMKIAKEYGFYFVDSKTSEQSVAEQVAREQGLTAFSRDIFLDPIGQGISIEGQWQKALKLAKHKGHVVVICHPYPSTVTFLQKLFSQPAEGYRFARISELVADEPSAPVSVSAVSKGQNVK